MRFNALTDGYDDGIRWQTDRLHTRGIRPGTVGLVMFADDLRLCPQGGHMMAGTLFDPQRRMEGQNLGALGDGAFHLFRLSRHILLPSAIDTGDLLAPRRMALRVTSMATLPPPTTTTF